MVATTWWQIFLAGMLGPVMLEFAKLANWHDGRRIKRRWKDPEYWLVTGAFILLGGLLVLFTLGVEPNGVSVLRAAHLGATAPLIVTAWASGASPRSSQTTASVAPNPQHSGREPFVSRFAYLMRW